MIKFGVISKENTPPEPKKAKLEDHLTKRAADQVLKKEIGSGDVKRGHCSILGSCRPDW